MKCHINARHEGLDVEMIYIGEKNYKCYNCDFKTGLKGDLSKHILEVHHDGKKDSQCDLCGSRYTSKKSLQRHKSYAHTDGKEVLCHICSKIFGSDLVLKKHIQSEHGTKYQKCLCHICSKAYGSELILKKHIQIEHSKDHKCQHCDKRFNTKIALTTLCETVREIRIEK